MINQLKDVAKNFILTLRKSEKIEIYVTPLIISCLFCVLYAIFKNRDFINFIFDFNKSIITFASILTAFSIAVVTILSTSTSENIRIAQNKIIKPSIKNINRENISYYQYVLVRSFYASYINVLLLLISIIYILIANIVSELIFHAVFFILLVFFTLHAILILVLVITALYHLLYLESN